MIKNSRTRIAKRQGKALLRHKAHLEGHKAVLCIDPNHAVIKAKVEKTEAVIANLAKKGIR